MGKAVLLTELGEWLSLVFPTTATLAIVCNTHQNLGSRRPLQSGFQMNALDSLRKHF